MSQPDEYNDVLLPQGTPVKKKSSKTCLILGIIGGLFLALALCCGIGGYFILGKMSSEFGDIAQVAFAGHPLIEEHLGELTEAKVNWWESVEIIQEKQKQNPNDKSSYLVIDVKGTNGTGKIVIKLNDRPGASSPIDEEGTELRLPNGDIINLSERNAPANLAPEEPQPVDPEP